MQTFQQQSIFPSPNFTNCVEQYGFQYCESFLQKNDDPKIPDCGGCWCVPEGGSDVGQCPDWIPDTVFSDQLIQELQSQNAVNPFQELRCNPIKDADCKTTPEQEFLDSPDAVCAFHYHDSDCKNYGMVTYENEDAALKAGDFVTHTGSCGLCSTKQDLSIYMAFPDLTWPGKKCAIVGMFSQDAGVECFQSIGFTKPCSQIWMWNTVKTKEECGLTCIKQIFEPNNGPAPMCDLNTCLQCDEDKSGPMFKQFAARTRRRSGLISQIVRPCDSIKKIDHSACPL